jgi:hypothetical protein
VAVPPPPPPPDDAWPLPPSAPLQSLLVAPGASSPVDAATAAAVRALLPLSLCRAPPLGTDPHCAQVLARAEEASRAARAAAEERAEQQRAAVAAAVAAQRSEWRRREPTAPMAEEEAATPRFVRPDAAGPGPSPSFKPWEESSWEGVGTPMPPPPRTPAPSGPPLQATPAATTGRRRAQREPGL